MTFCTIAWVALIPSIVGMAPLCLLFWGIEENRGAGGEAAARGMLFAFLIVPGAVLAVLTNTIGLGLAAIAMILACSSLPSGPKTRLMMIAASTFHLACLGATLVMTAWLVG